MESDDLPLIVEDKEFTVAALDVLGEDEIFKLKCFLTEQPEKGDLIPHSGGLRKLRWAAKGKGKRGGARIIYYYIVAPATIRLMEIYTKNEQENISPQALNQLKKRSHE
jgi:mRNA-degrading endonuclease RelE of RelBE toxin-antitoxin system